MTIERLWRFVRAEIYDVDYSQFVNVLGTTHFSRRSLQEAYNAVARLKPTDLGIELDMKRYRILHDKCATCPQSTSCTRKCEFIGAVDALENRNTNIWLIDMSRHEFRERLRLLRAQSSHWRVLLHARDALMAARLAWITTNSLKNGETPRVLALVEAAHVKGMRAMLNDPAVLKKKLDRFELPFTPPVLMRRVMIVGD